jgi:phospholipid-binding lipoprotein MlaA
MKGSKFVRLLPNHLSFIGICLLFAGIVTAAPSAALAADTALDLLQEQEIEAAATDVAREGAAAPVADWEYVAIHGQEMLEAAKFAPDGAYTAVDAEWQDTAMHGRELALVIEEPVVRSQSGAVSGISVQAVYEHDGAQLAQASTSDPVVDDNDVNDPLESLNRGIFAFNEFFLEWILGPISGTYKDFVPDIIREAIGNLLDNVATPTVLANDLLQAEFYRAWQTTERVVINSTIGLGGLIDVAEHLGIPHHNEDFGQTLAVWGVGEGFYLVLPFFGPSNPRDGIGKGVDGYFHPLTRWAANTARDEINYALGSANAVHLYSTVMDELNQVRKTSVDFYAALRSMYRQKRAAEIRNGAEVELPPIPDISYDIDEKTDEPTAGVGDRPLTEPSKTPQS